MINMKTVNVLALSTLLLVACDDDPTGPQTDGEAVVEGRVEQTTPDENPANGPAPAPGTDAQTVSVVQIEASGSYTVVATADVEADGSFRIEEVPAGMTNAAVVAFVDDREAGEVLIHGVIENEAVVRPAPITYETTMESRAYAELIWSGRADQGSSSEASLMLRAHGPDLEAALSSQTEIEAIADGYAEASAAMTEIFADAGASLDAEARGELLADAAVELAADLAAGVSVEAAHETYAEAAVTAFAEAGASLESIVTATAGAASAFDATVEGRTSMRGRLMIQSVLLSVDARQSLAAEHTISTEAVVALAVQGALATTRSSVAAAESAAELSAALSSGIDATIDVAVDASVELLAAGASVAVRNEVAAAAETALDEATLSARLSGASDASAVAAAAADYRADVRTAVEAMIEASGDTVADVDVLTDLFIAACADAYIR